MRIWPGPQPRKMHDVQAEQLGFLDHYISAFLPLTDPLHSRKKTKLIWNHSIQAAFLSAKQAICGATQLSEPNPHEAVNLAVDISNSHVRTVMQHLERGGAW